MTEAQIDRQLATLGMAIAKTREIVDEARELADHARASAVQTEAMHKAIMPAVIQLQHDVGGLRRDLSVIADKVDRMDRREVS